MADLGERLVENVRSFQNATGETGMMVVIEKDDEAMAVHRVQFDTDFGLLVDGRQPTLQWYQEAVDFHPLQWAPQVLH